MYSSGIDSPYLMSALIDIYEEELKSGVADSNCLDQVLEVGWYYYIVYPHYLTLSDKDWRSGRIRRNPCKKVRELCAVIL